MGVNRRRMGGRRHRRLDRDRRGGWRSGCRRLCRRLRRLLFGRFGRGLRFGSALQNVAHLFRHIERNGTGMCFLFRNAQPRQKINDGFGFYLQLASQFVNSDLGCVAHAWLRILLFLLSIRSGFLRWFSRCGMGLGFLGFAPWGSFRFRFGSAFESFGLLLGGRFGLFFCRFRRALRCGSGSYFTAFVEPVDGLVDFVHHFFADARNFHKLFGSHPGQLFE
jgi:hypothetical protein